MMPKTHHADIRRLDVTKVLRTYLPNKKALEALVKTTEAVIAFGDKFTGEHIYPSISRVSQITGASFRTIQRHLRILVDIGMLKIVDSYNWGMRLPREYALTRKYARAMIKNAIESATGIFRLKLQNTLAMLEKLPMGARKALEWRKSNTTGTKAAAPDVVDRSGSGLFPGSDGLTGQNVQLPPSLQSGELTRSESDGSAAASSPVFSWAALLHAHAKPPKPSPHATA